MPTDFSGALNFMFDGLVGGREAWCDGGAYRYVLWIDKDRIVEKSRVTGVKREWRPVSEDLLARDWSLCTAMKESK